MSESRQKLFPQERWDRIESLIEQNGRVSVEELTGLLGVSRVTIRSDLEALERRGVLVRTHGGAVDNDQVKTDLSFEARAHLRMAEKNRIGEAAARLVMDGDAIAVDASTTALEVVRRIKSRRELTVITNAIRVALELDDAPGVTVVMPGGILRRGAASLVGELGEEVLSKFNVQKGFFGAKGITLEEGLTDVDAFEVQLKRSMVRAAKQVVALVDHSKWGRVAFASFARLDQLDLIITDVQAPEAMVGMICEQGIEVVRV